MDNEIESIVQALINGETIKNFKPRSRTEAYLKSALMKKKIDDLPNPQSRLDVLLCMMNDVIHREYSTKFDEGYAEGNTEGYDSGYDVGYSEGNAAGQETGRTEGYEEGYSKGNEDGLEAGYNQGNQEGYDRGYDTGYSEGNTAGYAEGHANGVFEGYDNGYSEGNTAGYHSGHEDGVTEGYESGYSVGVTDGTEAGKQAEYDAFWDSYQANGTRTDYRYAFGGGMSTGWNKENFKPKYDVKPSSRADYMFAQTQTQENSNNRISMKELEEELGITFDFSKVTNATGMFRQSFFKELNAIDLSNCGTVTFLCQSESTASRGVERIERLIFKKAFTHNGGPPFGNCVNLAHIGFEGTIDCNTLDLSPCPLDHESLLAFVNCLVDKTGVTGTWSATLGSTNLAKLTEDEKTIATGKGWNLK